MGFNKRIVHKENVIKTPEERLERLFTADALIMDEWTGKFLELYNKGHKKEEIIEILDNGNDRFLE